MGVQVSHFVRDTLIVVFGYLALVAAAWLGLGFGGALVAAIGAGALIALFLPLVFIHYEEQALLHPRGRMRR
jgi:hypothetical protein